MNKQKKLLTSHMANSVDRAMKKINGFPCNPEKSKFRPGDIIKNGGENILLVIDVSNYFYRTISVFFLYKQYKNLDFSLIMKNSILIDVEFADTHYEINNKLLKNLLIGKKRMNF